MIIPARFCKCPSTAYRRRGASNIWVCFLCGYMAPLYGRKKWQELRDNSAPYPQAGVVGEQWRDHARY